MSFTAQSCSQTRLFPSKITVWKSKISSTEFVEPSTLECHVSFEHPQRSQVKNIDDFYNPVKKNKVSNHFVEHFSILFSIKNQKGENYFAFACNFLFVYNFLHFSSLELLLLCGCCCRSCCCYCYCNRDKKMIVLLQKKWAELNSRKRSKILFKFLLRI